MDPLSNAIASLENLIRAHKIEIDIITQSIFRTDWFLIELKVENERFRFQVDDEYHDLKLEHPPLSLCLVLRSLEEYKEATDFLTWSKKTGIEPNNNALEYFRTLAPILIEIENLIEPINSFVSDIEFTLNSGAAYKLRNQNQLNG